MGGPGLTTRVRVAAAAASLLLTVEGELAIAQDWRAAIQAGLVNTPVVGLLNLPEILSADCAPSTTRDITLFSAPSPRSEVIGSLLQPQPCQLVVRRAGSSATEELPTTESDYERPAGIVLQREGSWFRIALQQRSAWIEHRDSRDFLPYPDLLKDQLAYLPVGWDGRLYPMAGSPTVDALPPPWRALLSREVPVVYLGTMRVGAQVWIHVRLDPSARCGDALEGASAVTGWIPAHRSSGVPSAWFYSRGC